MGTRRHHIKNIQFELSYKIYFAPIIFDIFFYALGSWSFYQNFYSFIIASFWIIYKFNKGLYAKSITELYGQPFIDYLNQLNSLLAIGTSVGNAIIETNETYLFPKYIDCQPLTKAVKMGLNSKDIYPYIYNVFPIVDAKVYSNLLITSSILGSDPAKITNLTLDKLAHKIKTQSQIQQILYEKKLEQMILSIAPVAIILFINSSSSDYMEILYSESIGVIIMSLAYAILILMKELSSKLVDFKI